MQPYSFRWSWIIGSRCARLSQYDHGRWNAGRYGCDERVGGGNAKFIHCGRGLGERLFLSAVALRVSIPLLAVCGFGFMFSVPLMNAASQPSGIEGRARCAGTRLRRAPHDCLVESNGGPLLAAPLADYVFKPGCRQAARWPRSRPIIALGPIMALVCDRFAWIAYRAGRDPGIIHPVIRTWRLTCPITSQVNEDFFHRC